MVSLIERDHANVSFCSNHILGRAPPSFGGWPSAYRPRDLRFCRLAPGAVAPPTRRSQRLWDSATLRPSAGVQDRQVDGSSVRARVHLLLRCRACVLQRRPRSPSASDAGIYSRSSTALTGRSSSNRSLAERSSGLPSSPSTPRHEVPGFGAVGSPVRFAPGTVAPVLPRVSARQPEPTAGWRDWPRLRRLLAANQWIAETSAVVEPILRRPSPHSLPIESLLLPEAKARPISSRGEKTRSPGTGRGELGGDSGPRLD